MEQDYSDLRDKTVFDFTDEETAVKYALCSRAEHEKRAQTNKWSVVNTFIRFATMTNNLELLREVKKQFSDVINKVFNE